jgi:hypothetical protein
LAACRASSLSVRFGGESTTHAIFGALTVTNDGTAACRVTGRPTIVMRTGGWADPLRELPWNSSAFPGTHFRSKMLPRPDHSASVRTARDEPVGLRYLAGVRL